MADDSLSVNAQRTSKVQGGTARLDAMHRLVILTILIVTPCLIVIVLYAMRLIMGTFDSEWDPYQARGYSNVFHLYMIPVLNLCFMWFSWLPLNHLSPTPPPPPSSSSRCSRHLRVSSRHMGGRRSRASIQTQIVLTPRSGTSPLCSPTSKPGNRSYASPFSLASFTSPTPSTLPIVAEPGPGDNTQGEVPPLPSDNHLGIGYRRSERCGKCLRARNDGSEDNGAGVAASISPTLTIEVVSADDLLQPSVAIATMTSEISTPDSTVHQVVRSPPYLHLGETVHI